MNKKGAELSMNVIVIAILVIIVLIVVAAAFVGGFSKLTELIFGISPSSVPIAATTCSSSCDLARTLSSDSLKKSSDYCTKTWKFDTDGDGKIEVEGDGSVKRHHCYESPINQNCPGVEDFCSI